MRAKIQFNCILVAFSALLLVAVASSSLSGVDVSEETSQDTFACLKSSGVSFAIVRAFRSNGEVDEHAPATIANAHAAGMQYVDVYLFPCPLCHTPAEAQVRAAVGYLRNSSATFGRAWLDIEGAGEYWSGDCKGNVAWIQSALSTLDSLGVPAGVYTTHTQWKSIACNDESVYHRPLWYAHYDGKASFADFEPFGGWEQPVIKQYMDSTPHCSASADSNWAPQ